MKENERSNKVKENRVITYSFYEIGKLTAVVNAVYKKENAPNINNVLLKLMQTDVENTKNDD